MYMTEEKMQETIAEMVQRYSDLKKRRGTLTAKVTGFAATFQQAHVELTQPSRRNMFDFNNLPDKGTYIHESLGD
jgi:hypothetical protein